MRHHVEKVCVVDCSGAFLIDVCNHSLDFFLFGFKTESSHGDLRRRTRVVKST